MNRLDTIAEQDFSDEISVTTVHASVLVKVVRATIMRAAANKEQFTNQRLDIVNIEPFFVDNDIKDGL